MKYTVTVDPNREEEVLVYVHEKSPLTDKLEALLREEPYGLLGFLDSQIIPLEEKDVICFTVESNKVWAMTHSGKFAVKQRLYLLEQTLGKRFVKINQSCIANLDQIRRFDASIGGTLKVFFKNGHTDYVSRRNLKNIKERLGI